MIRNFVRAWDVKKNELKTYISTHNQSEYDEYVKLVKLLFDIVVNPYLVAYPNSEEFDTTRISVIDDGNWQGSRLFIIPKKTSQPEPFDYVVTEVYYGSCSGCDTLLAISKYDEGKPSKEQVEKYMTLCLHLLQRCKYLYTKEEDL